MLRASIGFSVACFMAIAAMAQEEPANAGRVELTRRSEVTVQAEMYRFECRIQFRAGTAEGVMALASDAEDIIESAVRGTPFEKVTPKIGDIELVFEPGDARAVREVSWSVGAAQFQGDKDRQVELGALADAFSVLAKSLNAIESNGPIPEVSDEQAYEDEAIAKALRASLVPAATAASVVNASVTSAVEIEVKTITWTPATLNTLTCTAEVRVSYAYEAGL